MRHRFMLLAVLLGVVLAFLVPQPAGADDGVDCIEDIVIDPTLCDDDIPPEPPPPRQQSMGPMGGGRGTPTQPGGMRPEFPGEVCDDQRNFFDRAGILESGRPDVLVYTFFVKTDFCMKDGIITRARITSSTSIVQPTDPRIKSISGTFTSVEDSPGGTTFLQVENVVTELFCPDGVNCPRFRHIYVVKIDTQRNPMVTASPQIIKCINPQCT